MGLGIAILASSRPYEGLLLCIPASVALLFWWLKEKKTEFFLVMRRTVFPLVLCVGVTAIAMGYYNWRVTGLPLRLPYQLNEMTYEVAPLFIFQSRAPQPLYNHDALREVFISCPICRSTSRPNPSAACCSPGINGRRRYGCCFLGPALTLPLLGCIAHWRAGN